MAFDDFDLDRFLDPKGIGARVEVLEQRRIRKGPAPTNLAVPEFSFPAEGVLRVG